VSTRPGMEIRVRRAESGDVSVVCSLFGGYLDFYGVSVDAFRVRSFLNARLARDDSLIFLAEAKTGEPAIGFAQIYPTFSSLALASMWILNDLFVSPRARRLGVGRALVCACIGEAQRAGVNSIELQTARDNHAAQSLYELEGFEQETTFVSYHRTTHGSRQS
jgi:ribosomal protein S18 acetylase RimI-like enzyme